jgi:hypothetical protein
MLSQHRRSKRPQNHQHVWKNEERKLETGFSYNYLICDICHEVVFPGLQLQKIYDYAESNIFLFVEDWVLLLLYAGHERTNHITGITRYQKMLFLIFYEFAQEHKIPSENPGFYGYLYGPFSSRIDAAIDFLIEQGYIKTSGKKSTSTEHFIITDMGKENGEIIFNKLSEKQKEDLKVFRQNWDGKTVRSLCKYIYVKYKEFTNMSIILKQLFPGTKLHRQRAEGPKVIDIEQLEQDEVLQES